jgi:hypothetical protein
MSIEKGVIPGTPLFIKPSPKSTYIHSTELSPCY